MKAVFVSIFGGLVFVGSRFIHVELTWWQLLVLGLATIRMARTLSFNTVAEFIRRPFCQVVPDSCGAGENVEPKGTGLRRAIGELLSCPICTGTWSAAVMVFLWVVAPGVVYVFAVAGLSEFLHWMMEMFEWKGREARVKAGQISPDRIAVDLTANAEVVDEAVRIMEGSRG